MGIITEADDYLNSVLQNTRSEIISLSYSLVVEPRISVQFGLVISFDSDVSHLDSKRKKGN